MGTPGDENKCKKIEETKSRQLEEKEGYETTAGSTLATQQADTTVLSHFPHVTNYIDYFQSPPSNDKVEDTPSLSQTYIDDFYAENKVTPSQNEQDSTFLSEPGPSGLQTPKTKSSTKQNIKRVKKSQSSKKMYTCQICQKSFQNINKLSKHQQIHGSNSPFKCEHCKKSFSSKFKLVRHMLIHSDRKPYSCSVCDRTFHRKDHMKNHIKVHSPCKMLYICERNSCKKEYTSLLSYKKHLALHSAEDGVLDCQICSKSFKTKEEIMYHLKIHAGSRTVKNPDEKKYSCEHCQMKFFTRKDVRRHSVVHTGRRDFLCQFCPQRFGRKDHLVRHIKKSHVKVMQSSESLVKEEQSQSIKSETEESNLSNPDLFATSLDFDSLLTNNLSILESSPDQFLPHTTAQGELTDLGSEVLTEIAGDDPNFLDILEDQTPLPAFSQTFQPPQPPPK